MNNLCSALVEQRREIELYLSFGATRSEAVSRLLREAVRSGAMPILNSMAVIGIISIPGMMTGQILGGSPVMQAARYQMLIMYLIAVSTFAAILMQVWVILGVGFDSSHMLRSDIFEKAPTSLSFFDLIKNSWFLTILLRRKNDASVLIPNEDEYSFLTTKSSRLRIEPLNEVFEASQNECNNSSSLENVLLLDGLTKSLVTKIEQENNDIYLCNKVIDHSHLMR